MRNALRFSSSILYADDTTIYVIGKNLHAMKAKIESDLSNISMWLNANKLLLNVSKTKSLLFLRENTTGLDLEIDGQKIKHVKCIKFLAFI